MINPYKKNAKLVLSNGIVFPGFFFGASGTAIGEIVFNTGMTGYQEVITDPSYFGQILTFTYPEIGNTGINFEDSESNINVKGIIVRNFSSNSSNWRSKKNFNQWLVEKNIIGLYGIDTRALVKILRSSGSMNGVITSVDKTDESCLKMICDTPMMEGLNLSKVVSTKQQYLWKSHTQTIFDLRKRYDESSKKLGTFQLESGFISIGGLVALILYVERLVFPTALLGFTLNTFQLGQVSLDRVEEIFQNNPNIVDRAETKFLERKVKGFLEAKNLKIKYPGSKFNSLNGLNFKIYPGELIAIVGPVGCGKTTLAKSLGRTIEIPDNQLFLDEIDIKTIKLSDLRKNISIVPQEAFLFTSTISENLSFGEPKASKYLVKESATKAGLIDDINSFPQRFKTIVGERGITLSGGQRQRTALGRALLVNSPIVVLDDALASVDNKTAARIIDEMSGSSNKTIIMISHQLSVAATCDRVLVMDKGEIVQEGIHKDLVKVDGLYKKLWERELATRIVKS